MLPVVLSPATCYATKGNIGFPGTSTQATANDTAAQSRLQDVQPSGVTITVAGATKVAR